MSEELREHRLKRMHMRSMRRGIKEMDLILTAYAGANLADMSDAMLDSYDALLNENDQDLIRWVTGQEPAPEALARRVEPVVTLPRPWPVSITDRSRDEVSALMLVPVTQFLEVPSRICKIGPAQGPNGMWLQ